jgi:hypothetical protein
MARALALVTFAASWGPAMLSATGRRENAAEHESRFAAISAEIVAGLHD